MSVSNCVDKSVFVVTFGKKSIKGWYVRVTIVSDQSINGANRTLMFVCGSSFKTIEKLQLI